METKRINRVWRCLGVIGAYWGLILFGPALVMIVNNANARFSGAGFYEGSIGYKLLAFFSQPIACGLAHSAAKGISKDEHKVCVLVNEIIAACLMVLLAISVFFILGELWNALTYTVSVIVTIVNSVLTAKTLNLH